MFKTNENIVGFNFYNLYDFFHTSLIIYIFYYFFLIFFFIFLKILKKTYIPYKLYIMSISIIHYQISHYDITLIFCRLIFDPSYPQQCPMFILVFCIHTFLEIF